MKNTIRTDRAPVRAWLLAGLLMLTASGVASAVEIELKAESRVVDLADGQSITIWGYGLLADTEVTSPGPVLEVPPGDDVLTVHLTNNLPVSTSLVIPGLRSADQPVKFYDSQGRARVRAFAHETSPGQVGTYTWNGVKAGSYLYRSGSHVAVQGQMGLFGALKIDHGVGVGSELGVAYPGQGYGNEALVVFSELDPVLHAAVASGDYGTSGSVKSTVNYAPKYFLINGASSPAAALLLHHPVEEGERVLIRMFNAGLKSHVPTVTGHRLLAVAEDGLQYAVPRDQVSVLLAAGKTLDAILVADSAGTYSLFDRRLFLSSGAADSGGMAAGLEVLAAAAPAILSLGQTTTPKLQAASKMGLESGALVKAAPTTLFPRNLALGSIRAADRRLGERLNTPAALVRAFFGLLLPKANLAVTAALDADAGEEG